MENQPISLSDYRHWRLVLALHLEGLPMRHLPGLACHGKLAATLSHDLLVTAFQPGIGYVTPKDRLEGRDAFIWEERRRKLAQAQRERREVHRAEASRTAGLPPFKDMVPALA